MRVVTEKCLAIKVPICCFYFKKFILAALHVFSPKVQKFFNTLKKKKTLSKSVFSELEN